MELKKYIQSKALICTLLNPMLLIMTVRLVVVCLSDVHLSANFSATHEVKFFSFGATAWAYLIQQCLCHGEYGPVYALSFHWANLCVRPYQHTTQLGMELDLVAVTPTPLVSLCAEHGNGLLWQKKRPFESKVLTVALQPAATNCSAAHLAPYCISSCLPSFCACPTLRSHHSPWRLAQRHRICAPGARTCNLIPCGRNLWTSNVCKP